MYVGQRARESGDLTEGSVEGSVDEPRVGRRCAFCGAVGKLHKEHVFPDWIGRLWVPDLTIRHTRGFEDRDGATEGAWFARPFRITVTAVCKECNSGWMSDLEKEAAPILTPMIRGARRALSEDDQATVALWSVKTAMMAAFTHLATSTFRREQYKWVHQQRSPPRHHQVWLAARARGVGEWPFSYRSAGLTVAPKSLLHRLDPNGHRITVVIGHLVIHIYGHAVYDGPVLDFGKNTGRALISIWPVVAAVEWPPHFALGPERLRGLTPGPPVQPVAPEQP